MGELSGLLELDDISERILEEDLLGAHRARLHRVIHTRAFELFFCFLQVKHGEGDMIAPHHAEHFLALGGDRRLSRVLGPRADEVHLPERDGRRALGALIYRPRFGHRLVRDVEPPPRRSGNVGPARVQRKTQHFPVEVARLRHAIGAAFYLDGVMEHTDDFQHALVMPERQPYGKAANAACGAQMEVGTKGLEPLIPTMSR